MHRGAGVVDRQSVPGDVPVATHPAPASDLPAIQPAALRYSQPVGERPGRRVLCDRDLLDAARAANLQGAAVPERLGIGRRREHQRQDDGQGDRKVTAAHAATATLPAGSDGASGLAVAALGPVDEYD
jgi:hypothetical protein